ncbi:hypothetical protein BDZ89DRAFT_1145037 [Hymenopellis radicata]|nr:hypothetical protein BDZ89DRAFT_1145037 [Hymenopellis radicata]
MIPQQWRPPLQALDFWLRLHNSSSLIYALRPTAAPDTAPLEASSVTPPDTPLDDAFASLADDQLSGPVGRVTEPYGADTTAGPTTNNLNKKKWYCCSPECEGKSYEERRGFINHCAAEHLNALFFCPLEGCGKGYPHFASLNRHFKLDGGRHEEHLRGLMSSVPHGCTAECRSDLKLKSEKDIASWYFSPFTTNSH